MSQTSNPPHVSDGDGTEKTKTETQVAVGPADFDAEVAAAAPSLRGPPLTAAIAFVAGTGFTLFG